MSSDESQYRQISEAPTNPRGKGAAKGFDVGDLYQGPAAEGGPAQSAGMALDEKLRQAYFWVANHAIINPFYDIEYNDAPPAVITMGDSKSPVSLPTDQSYSSFVLLPLLNFAVRKRCLLVGGPGRGKTASAVLMGVLAGYPLKELRRAILHGQPQMTIADLLGNPLPSALVEAKSADQIQISWRKWLSMRIKIIDEYNRIPTRTQSALLTVMADNYAEMFDQTFECPEAAWYLTANDDAGGGTYQVIEALKDRIDVVVKALHFNSRFLKELLERIELNIRPEEVVPPEIIFTEKELDEAHRRILSVGVPPAVRRRLEFFVSWFEFMESAGQQLEYKTKDTLKLAGVDFRQAAATESGKDRLKDLGLQTQNGLSVRSLMTALVFAKAMAFFRGNGEVSLEDLRQIMPFVLHDKMTQNPDAPFFEQPGHGVFRSDKVGWIRRLFDLACAEYERLNLDRQDPVGDLAAQFEEGLEGLKEKEVQARLARIVELLEEWSRGRKFYGHMYDDVLQLKYLHQRYTNYLKWLRWKGG